MKPLSTLVIALLFGSIPLAAQQGSYGTTGQFYSCITGPTSSSQSAPHCGPQVPPCPAMLKARHLADGSMIRAGLAHPKGIGQWLQISLDKPKATSATLTVHGFSNQGRVTWTGGGNGPDAVRTVTVSLAPAQNGQAAGAFWAPGLTAVDSLDLISLNYSDGTSWSAASGQTCRVTPDPLMLISGR